MSTFDTSAPAPGPSATPRALVRRPSPRLADGLLTHIERIPVDLDRAGRQWSTYVETLAVAGWPALEVAPAPEQPDSVFIEDAVVMFGGMAVITNPGADERRGEIAGAVEAVTALGYPTATIRDRKSVV